MCRGDVAHRLQCFGATNVGLSQKNRLDETRSRGRRAASAIKCKSATRQAREKSGDEIDGVRTAESGAWHHQREFDGVSGTIRAGCHRAVPREAAMLGQAPDTASRAAPGQKRPRTPIVRPD